MTARLTLICHGATAATRAAAFPADWPLEENVIAPTVALRPILRRANTVWSSPALCTRQTAEALGLEAVVEPALRDCDHGGWAGRTLADVYANDPEGLAAWRVDLEAVPHGGESLGEVLRRVSAWMSGLTGENGHLIAITHPTIIRAAILHVLDAPALSFWRIDIPPLSLSRFSSDGTRWVWKAGEVVSTEGLEPPT